MNIQLNPSTETPLPEWVEVIENCEIAFRRNSISTIEDIEKDIVRTLGDLRHMPADGPEALETYERISGLWALRTQRLGKDDGWVKKLIDAILRH